MDLAFFEFDQLHPLIVSGFLLVVSVLLFEKYKNTSLSLLFIGTLSLGYFIANLDPFLTLWDEQFHALVAKNLSENFLQPMLYADPVLDFDYRNWTNNQLWLHKQPLFLWQIALSIKAFSTTELAVRLPSIIMHAILPIIIYRIGSIVKDIETGYYALLFAVAYFPLELIVGGYPTDHNDIAFLFYTTASFWAWFEYERSKKKYWIVLIGLFSGCAVLVKWLMGLLVFVIWTITKTLTSPEERLKVRSYIPLFISGTCSLFVFLPWQFYIGDCYPKESAYEYGLNSRHFFEAIEGHQETTWFHFTDAVRAVYGSGDLLPFILLFALVFLIVRIPLSIHKVALASSVLFVYGFYTIASTKMVSFTLIVAPFVYLGLGHLVRSLLSFIRSKVRCRVLVRLLVILIPLSVAHTALNLRRVQNYHTEWKPNDNRNRKGNQIEMEFIHSIKNKLEDGCVIFNASITMHGHIPIMFYTDYVAYEFIPSESQVKRVKEQNRKVAILDLGELPDYILKDKDIQLLNVERMKELGDVIF